MNLSNTHASGFQTDEGQHQISMRVSRVLDLINIKFKADNFIPILYTIIAIVSKQYPKMNRWHRVDVIVECLNSIDELQCLQEIFQASVEHTLIDLEKRKRVCSICLTS